MNKLTKVTIPKLATSSECTGCMGCINACSHDVLSAQYDNDGFLCIDVKNPSKCVACGLCSKSCPVISEPKKRNKYVNCYAAWNDDSIQRAASASGGVFSALASKILDGGGVVYGAAIEGFSVVHIRVSDLKDLNRIQGTKYQLSDTTCIYKQVRQDLVKGLTVLFSGMSCQVAALFNYLGNINTDKLYTVDTICGGYSTMLPMNELQKHGGYKGIYSFRDKQNGWKSRGFKYNLRMRRLDGTIEDLGDSNLVIKSFSSILMKQSSCLACKFNGVVRLSDITIGDYWQDENNPSQHNAGLSCVVTHNDKGEAIIHASKLSVRPTSIQSIGKGNSNLYWSQYRGIRHLISRKIAMCLLRNKKYNLYRRIISYSGLLSLEWRLYLRYNNKLRIRAFKDIK